MTPPPPSDHPVDPWARGGAMSDPDRVVPGPPQHLRAASAERGSARSTEGQGPAAPAVEPSRDPRAAVAVGAVLALVVAVVLLVRLTDGDDAGSGLDATAATTTAATGTTAIAPTTGEPTSTAEVVTSQVGAEATAPAPPAFTGPVGLHPSLAAHPPFELDLFTTSDGSGFGISRVAVPSGEVLATTRVRGSWGATALVATRTGLVLQDATRPGLVLVHDDLGITEVGPELLDDVWQVTGLADADEFWAISLPAASLGSASLTARRVDLFGVVRAEVPLDVIGRRVLPAAGGTLLFADASGTFRTDGATVDRFSSGSAVAAGPAHVLQRICTRGHACRFEVLPTGGGTVEHTFELDIDLIDAWLSPDGASLVGIEDSGSSSGAAAQVRPPRLVHLDLTTGQRTPLTELGTLDIPPAGMQAGMVAWASPTLLLFVDGAGGVAAYDRATGAVVPVLTDDRGDVVALAARALPASS